MLAELLQQKLLEQRGIVHLRREEYAARRGLACQIVLLDKRRKRVVRLLRHRQDLIVLIHEVALDKVQHREAGFLRSYSRFYNKMKFFLSASC